jgi:hypothetical protein
MDGPHCRQNDFTSFRLDVNQIHNQDFSFIAITVKLGDKERLDSNNLAIVNNFAMIKKFPITKFDCTIYT